MKRSLSNIISLDREDMTETERALFLTDLNKVTEEYFETHGDTSLEITRSEEGFIICVLITARRIKNVKSPQ